jgi:rhodanese-related sulfurtransferase
MAEFPPQDVLEISCQELLALRQAAGGEPFRLVDCREEDEFRFNRIEGAQLVPLSGFGVAAPKVFADPAERVIIYCHHGMRSGQAAHFLRQRGHASVWSLAGGIHAWASEIDETVGFY